MEQPADNYRVDYCNSPTPDADDRLCRAFDIILQLILADAQTDPDRTPEQQTQEGVP